jgi:hypothetical protein
LQFETVPGGFVDSRCPSDTKLATSQLSQSFEELLTPHYQSGKRPPSSSRGLVSASKRFRGSQTVEIGMSLEMYHPENQMPSHFRCYFEGHVFEESVFRSKMLESNMDDDCPTDDEQIEAATLQLERRLVSTINSFRPGLASSHANSQQL